MGFLDNNGLERLWDHIIEKLGNKVDKQEGKNLSSNDYTNEEKIKLQNIPGNLATKEYVDNSIKEYFVNVKSYGAVGDGITDDTNAIQTALNENKNVFIPSGTYLLTSPIAIWQHKTNLISHGTLLVNNCTAISVTSNYCKIDLNDIVSVTEYTGCGIQLGGSNVYTYYNDIKVKNLYKLAEGIKIAPDGPSGIAYTSFAFKEINALKGIYFCPGNNSGSYINENYFIGGALICTNPIITEKNGAIDNFNGNKFEHISLEGCTNGIILNSATYNRFNNCRMSKYENSSLTTFITLDKNSYGNVFNISTPLFIDKIIDNNEDGTPNEFCGDLRYIEDSAYLGTKCYSNNYGLYIKDSDRYYTFINISDDIYNDYTLPYVIEGNTYHYDSINTTKELNVSNIYGYGKATFFFVSIYNLVGGSLTINVFDGTTKTNIGIIDKQGIYRIESSDSGGWIISKLGLTNDYTNEEKEVVSKAITVNLNGTTSDETVLLNADLLGGLPASDYITADVENSTEGVVSLINADLLGGIRSTGFLQVGAKAADSYKLDGKDPKYYIQPRNLLDNSYWEKINEIVNQRGETSKQDNYVYWIDRWIVNTLPAPVELRDGGIYLPATRGAELRIIQRVPAEWISNGETYTLAVCESDGTIRCVSGVYNGNIIGDGIGDGLGYVALEEGNNNYVQFIIGYYKTVTLRWAALYKGSYTADNLPPYVPKGYAAEFEECRRYAKRIKGALAGIAHGYETGKAYATIFTSGPIMRIAPAVHDYSKILIINGEYYSANFTPITGISTIATRNDSITFWVESSEISAGKDYYISCDNGVLFSADL